MSGRPKKPGHFVLSDLSRGEETKKAQILPLTYGPLPRYFCITIVIQFKSWALFSLTLRMVFILFMGSAAF